LLREPFPNISLDRFAVKHPDSPGVNVRLGDGDQFSQLLEASLPSLKGFNRLA
jgi:hypothetical protein